MPFLSTVNIKWAVSSWTIFWMQLMIYAYSVCFIKLLLCMFLEAEWWTRWTIDVLYHGYYFLHFPSCVLVFRLSFQLFEKYLCIWHNLLSLILFSFFLPVYYLHSLFQENVIILIDVDILCLASIEDF